MNNKRGQTLILFVIILPIFLAIMALVVDVGLFTSKKIEIREVSKNVIKDILKENISVDEAQDVFIKNNIAVLNLKIDKQEDKVNLKNDIKIKSVFGSLIGLKEYEIKIDITGIKKDNIIEIE